MRKVNMDEEYRQYRVDQAEAWLSKVRRAVDYERALRATADAQLEMADGLRGIDYAEVRVATSPSPDAIPNAVAAHMEAVEAILEIAADAAERVRRATDALAAMPDKTEASALQLYYVAGWKWEEVCVEMGYTWDGMMKLRRRALYDAYEVMPHSEREPVQPAI